MQFFPLLANGEVVKMSPVPQPPHLLVLKGQHAPGLPACRVHVVELGVAQQVLVVGQYQSPDDPDDFWPCVL